jgi:chromate reductase
MISNQKILAFGASGSKTSINQKFAVYAANEFSGEIDIMDISGYSLPLYTIDEENENGLPSDLEPIYQRIKQADLLVISFSEHNGSYTAFFKNIFDWLSRRELKFLSGKKLFLLATAPGPRGGLGVLETAVARFPIHGGEIMGHFVLPKYKENFDSEEGIINKELKESFTTTVNKVLEKSSQTTIEN